MKNCKFCGKALDEQANFCPYCMKRLDENETITIPVLKKKKRLLWPILIGILAASLAVLAVVFFVLPRGEKEEAPQETESTLTLTDYLGNWEHTYDGGGKSSLYIINVTDKVIRFSFTNISAAGRIATINNIACIIEDGVGSFTFSDDSWGNSGSGKIRFMEDSIFFETLLNDENSQSIWSIATSGILTRHQKDTIDIDAQYGRLLGLPLKKVQEYFGEEIAATTVDEFSGSTYHYFDGISVGISAFGQTVDTFILEYDPDHPSRYSYKGIDGSTTYEEIINILGMPNDQTIDVDGAQNQMDYGIENGYMKIELHKDLTVSKITIFLPMDY